MISERVWWVVSCTLCLSCGGERAGVSNSGDTAQTQMQAMQPPVVMSGGTVATSVGAAGKPAAAEPERRGSSAAGAAGSTSSAGVVAVQAGGAVATAPGAAGSGGAAADSGGTDAQAGRGTAGANAAGSGGRAGAAGAAGEMASTAPPMFQKTRCIDPTKAKPDMELNYPCDGVDIWVVMPGACQMQRCGLIFNIHGGGMTDHATMDQATNMIALGSQAGYIVVHPHKGTWNVASDKDVVFDFMQQVITAFDVDRKRVHSTGYSQGGQISWALGCEHADVVASIAPAEEINRVSDCWKTSKLPARELPVLFAYGKQDSIGGGYAAAQTAVDQFVKAYQMMGPETIAGSESAKYWRQRWTSKTGNVLELITQNYTSTGVGGILAGHCLPMAKGNTFVSCALPVDYDWGKEALDFFVAHPLP